MFVYTDHRNPMDKNEFSDQETARRRDQALKRALKMPPQPHKPTKEKARKAQRQTKAKQSAT